MRWSLQQQVIQLADDRPLAFRGARGLDLECVAGWVWLTVEGQAGDFFLQAGERLTITSDGLAVVEGLPRGAVRLLRPAPWPVLRGAVGVWRWLPALGGGRWGVPVARS